MKLRTVISAAALALMLSAGTVGVANAGQPTNPGCFGAGRAAFATSGGDATGNVGYYASLRRSDNGAQNRAYAASCGGQPTQ